MQSKCCWPSSACAAFAKRPFECRTSQRSAPQLPIPKETVPLVPATGDNGGDGCDVLVSSGISLPAIFQTELRRWIMLFVFCGVNCFASGPMTMFPALEPILVHEKVFEGPHQLANLSTIYSLSWAVTMIAYFPLGLVYDQYGPKWIAVMGTWAFAVFSVGLGLAIRFQNLNWTMFFFYPVGVLFAYSKGMGGYGWHWLLPESQNTVNSLIIGIQVLTDSLVVMVIWLHHAYGMSLWTYFWAISVLSFATAILNSFIVPSQEEHLAYAAIVVAAKTPKAKTPIESSYGGTDHGCDALRDKEPPIRTSGWRWWDACKGTANTFVNYPVENSFFVSGILCLYMCVFYYSIQIYPFYLTLFGAAEADRLLQLYALIYSFLGAGSTILIGQFGDFFGLENMVWASIVFSLLASVLVFVETQAAQIAFMAIITIVTSLYQILVYRFCMVYAPAQLFGSYSGILACFMGLFQMGFNGIVSTLIPEMLRLHLVGFVQGATLFFGFVSAVSFLGLLVCWRWKPPPLAGSVSCREAGIPEDGEYEVQEEFSRQMTPVFV